MTATHSVNFVYLKTVVFPRKDIFVEWYLLFMFLTCFKTKMCFINNDIFIKRRTHYKRPFKYFVHTSLAQCVKIGDSLSCSQGMHRLNKDEMIGDLSACDSIVVSRIWRILMVEDLQQIHGKRKSRRTISRQTWLTFNPYQRRKIKEQRGKIAWSLPNFFWAYGKSRKRKMFDR